LRIAIRCTIEAKEVTAPGTGLIHGTRLAGLLKDAATDEILLSFDAARTEVKAGKSVFKLTSQEASQYPQLPVFPKASIVVDSVALAEMIRRTTFAVASEQGRYAIDGVSLTVAEGTMELAGTDGRRLSVATVPVLSGADMPQCVVPPKVLGEVRKLGDTAKKIELAVEGGMLLARAGTTIVAGTLIEGVFPKYKDMIPAPSKRTVRVGALAFGACLRQAEQLTAEDSRAVTFSVSTGTLTLESRSAAVGEASIQLGIQYEGEPMTMAFNARFFLDVLSDFGDEELSIEMDRSDKPAVIRKANFTYVIAPVRVRESVAE
jgi:DNA polymerase-3 subunit beta